MSTIDILSLDKNGKKKSTIIKHDSANQIEHKYCMVKAMWGES